jgi:hypothetical protein
MKSWTARGLVLASGAALVASSAPLASATPSSSDEAVESKVDVTRVQLRKGGREARVRLRVVCQPDEKFSLAVEVLQDSDPADDKLDALYRSTKLTEGTCTGEVQRFKVRVVPDKSGDFAPKKGRLKKGAAEETAGGDFQGMYDAFFFNKPVVK